MDTGRHWSKVRESQRVFRRHSINRSLSLELEHCCTIFIGRMTAKAKVAETVALDVCFDKIVEMVIGERKGPNQCLGREKDQDVGLEFER